MRASGSINMNQTQSICTLNPSILTNKKSEEIDFPLNGKSHPTTIRHHRIMKNLRPNEIRFTVEELVEMLDDPSSGHLTKNCLSSTNKTNMNRSYTTPRNPKGI